MTSPTKEPSDSNTANAFNHLAERGRDVSKEKARIPLQRVEHFRFIVEKGHRAPSKERKGLMSQTAGTPSKGKQLQGFLGMLV